ncbi:exopolysaccharide biosynthesis protein [Candidatus Laterigemmans baculatus]|uniref:exopolysaccharide biosynthesis protein n=1 Tax=Candidatus Laterigemmans baculatus TaxID=2770505 RepID=UPI001F3993E4|nr:exopolysaccharide biosynthesis protein [Candidatus Laterigemmans baculatus]
MHSLHDVLDRVESAAENREKVSLGQVLDALGERSFAPLILVPGLIMLAPGPADIPGVPIVLGLFVALVAVQPLLRREHIWIPQWMERRELSSRRIKQMVSWLRRPAGWLDRLTKRRYTGLVNHAGALTIAVACILIAASTPLLEFVPFSANLAGGAITAFALALLAKDGLVAGIAILFSLGTLGLVLYQFIGG